MQRNIELIIKPDSLGHIIKDLLKKEEGCWIYFNINNNTFELTVTIEESAVLFKKLSTDPGILSWDFEIKDKKEIPESEKSDDKIEVYSKDEQNIPGDNILVPYFTNYNEAATWIEATWKLSKKSPNLIFGSQLFKKEIALKYDIVANSSVTVEHSLLCMILENYYKDTDFKTSYEDIVEKIKNNWKGFNQHPSLASIAKLWS